MGRVEVEVEVEWSASKRVVKEEEYVNIMVLVLPNNGSIF